MPSASTARGRTARGPRGEYSKSAARREQILTAALTVFATSGFREAALREIAERADLSQAGLLHHFPNKTTLLEAVLVWRDEKTLQQFDIEHLSPIEHIRNLVRLVEYNQSTPGLVELYTTLAAEATAADHPAHQYFVTRYRWSLENIRHNLEAAAAEGILRDGVDPATAGRAVIALMDGLQIQWLLDRTSVDMATEVRAYLQTLLAVDL